MSRGASWEVAAGRRGAGLALSCKVTPGWVLAGEGEGQEGRGGRDSLMYNTAWCNDDDLAAKSSYTRHSRDEAEQHEVQARICIYQQILNGSHLSQLFDIDLSLQIWCIFVDCPFQKMIYWTCLDTLSFKEFTCILKLHTGRYFGYWWRVRNGRR